MSKKRIIERMSLAGARYIKENGGHPDVTVGTMRFSLQLWITQFLTVLLAVVVSLFFGTVRETLSVLASVGILRYFSGGWHFRSLEVCILFTSAIAISIPLLPQIDGEWLAAMNILSLVLVLLLAPTGHGQKFRSDPQKTAFKWISVSLVLLNFIPLFQNTTISFLFQSLTLITPKGGRKT